MKKLINLSLLLLISVLLFSISGCFHSENAENSQNATESASIEIAASSTTEPTQAVIDESTNEPTQEITEQSTTTPISQTVTLAVVPQMSASGSYNIALLESKQAALVEQEFSAAEAYPIFVDPYPTGIGGPVYEITEEVLAKQEENLLQYLSCLYGEGEYETFYNSDITHKVQYEDENIRACASVKLVTISSDNYQVYTELTTDILQENPLLCAAIAYTGFQDPVITKELRYNLIGEISHYMYRITELSEDRLTTVLNDRLSYISVSCCVETNTLQIKIAKIKDLEESGTTPLATRQEIDAFFAEIYPDAVPENYAVEVYYDNTVQLGYYIPCYRVYINEPILSEELSVPAYSIWELTDARFRSQSSGE